MQLPKKLGDLYDSYMKHNELPPKPPSVENNHAEHIPEIANALGGGRWSVAEKENYLKGLHERGAKLFHNADFVSVATYQELFKSLELDGKTILNVGAGYSIAPNFRGLSPMIEALSNENPEIRLIPLDYNHERNKSWLLLDTDNPKTNDNIHLEPVTGDAVALPFADNSIDGYLSSNLVNEPRESEPEKIFVKKVISEAYRVLKPGGFFIVSSFGYFMWQLEDGTIIYNDGIDIEEIVEKETVEKILKATGFSSIKEIPLDPKEIEGTLGERSARKFGTKRVGVRDACAFLAIK